MEGAPVQEKTQEKDQPDIQQKPPENSQNPQQQSDPKPCCPKDPNHKCPEEKCKTCPHRAQCQQQKPNSTSECPKDPKQKGFAEKCKGCPFRSQCQAQAANPQLPNIPEEVAKKLSQVKNIILVLSGKGGVGKSTIASQLALGLAKKDDLQVGLLDLDICGPSIPRMMGMEKEEIRQSPEGMSPVYKEANLAIMSIGFLLTDKKSAVIWRGPRKNGLIKEFLCNTAWDKLDYLIVDTPPGTSDEHLTLVQYLKNCNIKGSIIVTTPQEVSLLDVRKEINFCKKTEIKVLGVVENMAGFVCPHCGKETEIFEANTGGGVSLCEEFEVTYLTKLPLEPKILQSCEKGMYFPDSFPDSVTAKIFNNLVNTIINI